MEYTGFADLFWKKLAEVLWERIDANEQAIKLMKRKQLPY